MKTERKRVWFDSDINSFKSAFFEPKQGLKLFDSQQAEYLLALKSFLQQQSGFITHFNQAFSVFQQDAVKSVKQTMLRLVNELLDPCQKLGLTALLTEGRKLHDAIDQDSVTESLVEQVDLLLIESMASIEHFIGLTCSHAEPIHSLNILAEDRWQLLLQIEQLLLEKNPQAFELILKMYLYKVTTAQELLLDSALIAIEKDNFTTASNAIESLKTQLS